MNISYIQSYLKSGSIQFFYGFFILILHINFDKNKQLKSMQSLKVAYYEFLNVKIG